MYLGSLLFDIRETLHMKIVEIICGLNYSLKFCDRNMCLSHFISPSFFFHSSNSPHIWLLHQPPTSSLFHFCLSHTWLPANIVMKPTAYCILCIPWLQSTLLIDFYPRSVIFVRQCWTSYNLPVLSEVKCNPQPCFQGFLQCGLNFFF